MTQRAFSPQRGNNQTATAGAASASISITVGAKSVRVVNAGANVAFVRIGAGAQTATTADTPVLAGSAIVLTKADYEDTLAHISAAGSTLYVQCGEGGI
jgi:hypothetical protein